MIQWIRHLRFGNQFGYETFFRQQDRQPVGKTGVILADLGMPEVYDPDFYIDFMDHVFRYSLPVFVQRFVLKNRGTALIDPANPLAREPFVPLQLVDMNGSFTNQEGRPYAECKLTWCPPGIKKNPLDHGYFLYSGDGKGCAPEVCQKTGAKVIGWYYGHLLPEKKVAWEHQCKFVYEETVSALKEKFPHTEFRHAYYAYEKSLSQTVEELLAQGCKTIVYQCFCNPVYSDFEDYAFGLSKIHRFVNKRAKIICADQLGNQPAMRGAYVQIIRDQLLKLPPEATIFLILSKHGHPFKKETQDKRGAEYRLSLETDMRSLLGKRGVHWDLVWSDDEYADEYWDPGNRKLSTYSAYCRAIQEGFDYALEVPTDFIAENTDLMIFHAMKKFKAFSTYDPYEPVPYPDWEKPLVRIFRQGKTTGIYAGCPVGSYRKFIVRAAETSITEILVKADKQN